MYWTIKSFIYYHISFSKKNSEFYAQVREMSTMICIGPINEINLYNIKAHLPLYICMYMTEKWIKTIIKKNFFLRISQKKKRHATDLHRIPYRYNWPSASPLYMQHFNVHLIRYFKIRIITDESHKFFDFHSLVVERGWWVWFKQYYLQVTYKTCLQNFAEVLELSWISKCILLKQDETLLTQYSIFVVVVVSENWGKILPTKSFVVSCNLDQNNTEKKKNYIKEMKFTDHI